MQASSGSCSLPITTSYSDQWAVLCARGMALPLHSYLQRCTGCTCNEGNVINIVNTSELVFQNHPFRSILHKCLSRMQVRKSDGLNSQQQ